MAVFQLGIFLTSCLWWLKSGWVLSLNITFQSNLNEDYLNFLLKIKQKIIQMKKIYLVYPQLDVFKRIQNIFYNI